MPTIGAKAKNKAKLHVVKSGIGLNAFDKTGKPVAADQPSFITSRTARVLLAGAGFLADAYDLFVINLVLRLLRDEYPEYATSGYLHTFEGTVASAALFGSILGQLVAGSLADIIGRKVIFVATAALITLGSIGSACTVDTDTLTIYGQIACWRFFLGAGVGGEYPLAATVTSESSSAGRRGSLMAAVFAMQGVGSLISVVVVLLCLGLGMSASFTWRFALAFGAVPAIVAFPWRLRMHETESFERIKQERRDAAEAADLNPSGAPSSIPTPAPTFKPGTYGGTAPADKAIASKLSKISEADSEAAGGEPQEGGVFMDQAKACADELRKEGLDNGTRWSEIRRAFRYYKYHMVGTALSWFLLDVDFYANGLFNHDVTGLILSNGRKTSALEDAWNAAFLCLVGVPGYWLSVFFLDSVGRKNVQAYGFIAMGVLFSICGAGRDWFLDESGPQSRKLLFLVLYSLTFLFSNFGPNTTTFIIPGEVFPPEVRATCHGISAASGKLGAATGAYFFPLILGPGGSAHPTSQGLRSCMFLCAFIAFLGAIVTYIFTPNYGANELESEDEYIQLEHSCLRPSDQQIRMLELSKVAKANAYAMVEVVTASDNYAMDYDLVMDERGGLVAEEDYVPSPLESDRSGGSGKGSTAAAGGTGGGKKHAGVGGAGADGKGAYVAVRTGNHQGAAGSLFNSEVEIRDNDV